MHQTGHFNVLPVFHPAAALYHREWQQYLDEDFAYLGQWLREHPAISAGNRKGLAMLPQTIDEKTYKSASAGGQGWARCSDIFQAGDVLVLTGDLGTGKTQLTKGVGHGD